jgi:hypothetical protein
VARSAARKSPLQSALARPWAAGRLALTVLIPYAPQNHTYTTTCEGGHEGEVHGNDRRELIPKAKEQARSLGVSLSDLIERALRGLTLEKHRAFSTRWRGRIKAARRKDDRYKALAEKYL